MAHTRSREIDLGPIERRELALAALVDVRTLERALAGESVRMLCKERIRRALRDRGLLSLLPASGER